MLTLCLATLEYVGLAMLESEMLLLEVDNMKLDGVSRESDLSLSQTMARRLLRQILPMQQVAVDLNDLPTVRFLSRWEMALFEIANLQPTDLEITLPMVQTMIQETGLVVELMSLQNLFDQPSSTDVL